MKYILLGGIGENGIYSSRSIVGEENVVFTQSPSSGIIDILKTEIDIFLPERQKVTNLEWLSDKVITIIKDDTTVSMTFLTEGAGYMNTIIASVFPPTFKGPINRSTIENIAHTFVLWPNLSIPYVEAGETVRIPNCIDDGNEGNGGLKRNRISENFYELSLSEIVESDMVHKKGTRIVFGLVPNAWKGSYIKSDNIPLFSKNDLNPEAHRLSRYVKNGIDCHSVCIQSSLPDYAILGFEDLIRDQAGCDDDFNDAVFAIKITPNDGIDRFSAITFVDAVSFDYNYKPKKPTKYTTGYKKVIYTHPTTNLKIECLATLRIPLPESKCENGEHTPSPKPQDGKSSVIICNDVRNIDKARTNYLYCESITVLNVPPELYDDPEIFIGQHISTGAKSSYSDVFEWKEDTWYYEPDMDITGSRAVCSVKGFHFFESISRAINYKF